MAFDWLGTFNKSQNDRLFAFVKAQTDLIEGRILHLESEKNRIGVPVFKYDESGVAVGYTVDPDGSYVAKLMAVYEILGGNPFLDLTSRLSNQPVYKQEGDETASAQLMSNGEVIGAPGLADAVSAGAIQSLRKYVSDTLYWRRDRLERKIRRALDYYDQLDMESQLLQKMTAGETVTGAVDFIAKTLSDLISNPEYRAIYDDKGSDIRGDSTQAPHSAYDNAPDGGYSRDRDGLHVPGQGPPEPGTGTA